MDINAKKQRMKELIEVLDKAAKAYYTESAEIMSNAEYDELYDELENLEKETGIVLAGSLTKKVGYEVLSSLPKKAPLPRLRKCLNWNLSWAIKRGFLCGS